MAKRQETKPNPRFAMPGDYEDAIPVPDDINDKMDDLGSLGMEEMQVLLDEIEDREYDNFDDMGDKIREMMDELDREPDQQELDEHAGEMEYEQKKQETDPIRFGRKAPVKRKSSRQSGENPVSPQFKSIVRTARSLMAGGSMGQELWNGVHQAHPTMTPDSRKRLSSFLREEVGFLGQVAHDPNLFPSCKTARIAKEKHPRKEGLILTYRTPMCGSCDHNKGSRCALMGGSLVGGPDDTPETAVVRTAKTLVNQERLEQHEANRVVKAKASAGQRVAALHILSTTKVEDPVNDIRAIQGSRQAASILDPAENSMYVPAQSLTGPGRTASRDQNEEESFGSHAGDEKVSRRASKVASLLASTEIPVEVPDRGAAPRADVQLDPFASFTVPTNERRSRKASAVEENSLQAGKAFDKFSRVAGKLMAMGHMTTETAAKVYTRLDELQQFGVIPTEAQARVKTQIAALAGHLEL